MMNMQSMMKQAQKMQKQMQATQEELNNTEFTGKSAQDLVLAVFTGDKRIKQVTIKPEVIDAEDPETLQEMVLVAVNDAMDQIDQATEQKLGKFANLPF